jgi:hypothetical protein
VSRVRCIDCGRHVHATLGGAWCEVHRPVDLTGGVLPWDRSPRVSRGYVSPVRAAHGQVPRMLEGAGWQRVTCIPAGPETMWRDPSDGRIYTQTTARKKATCAKASTAPSGRPRAASDEIALGWIERLDAGERYASVAQSSGVSVSTVQAYVKQLRRVLGAA